MNRLLFLVCGALVACSSPPDKPTGSTGGPAKPAPACAVGRDQTCNDLVEMSALAGTCKPDGTCACKPGYTLKTSGKCGPVPVCTPGLDQTCNDDSLISSITGACDPAGTCSCHPGFKKQASGRCR